MAETTLVRYDEARRAVAACRTVDEAKDIADKAMALQAYARQAHDQELEGWVAEIRLRARRRIGDLSVKLDTERERDSRTGILLPTLGKQAKSAALKTAGLSTSEAHRCDKIASVPESDFERVITERKGQRRPVTADDVVRVLAKQAKRVVPIERGSLKTSCTVEDLDRFTIKCGTVYADPPWRYGNQGTRASTGDHYVGMSVEEICALPVANIAAENSHIHLWTTNAFLFEAQRVLTAWGFTYKSCYIWVKPQMGMGNYWRVSHEFLLLGVRGSTPFSDRSLMSWGQFARRKHSAKPEEIRQLIERASPGPRIELFARRKAPGWYVWGNEIERSVFDNDIGAVA